MAFRAAVLLLVCAGMLGAADAPAAAGEENAGAAAPAAAGEESAGAAAPADEQQAEVSARLDRIDKEIADLRKIKKELEQLGKDVKKEKERTGFLSDLDQRFDLGGKVELEFIDSQDGRGDAQILGVGPDTVSDGNPFLFINKIRLMPKVDFTRKEDPVQFSLAGQLDFLPRDEPRARVKEFYATAEGRHTTWAESQLKIGLEDRFMTPNHDTRMWPIASTAFWRNEELGLFWRTRLGDVLEPWGRLGIHGSLSNGIRLVDEDPNEAEGFEIIGQDARFGGSGSNLREYGVGLEWERRWIEEGDVPLLGRVETEVLGFYYNDSMGDEDIQYLQSSRFAGSAIAVSNLRGRELWGGNAVLYVGGFRGTAHLMQARDGRLERKAGYLEANYRWEFAEPLFLGQIVRAATPLVRYEWLDVRCPPIPAQPVTYDRERLVVAVIADLMKTVFLKTEYAFNKDDTGGRDPKTNELVVTLEVRF